MSKLVATAALDTVAEEADDSAVSMIFSILGAVNQKAKVTGKRRIMEFYLAGRN